MLTKQELVPGRRTTPGWSEPKDRQNKTDLHLALCNSITLRGHEIFVVSLAGPFFVDCIIFHQ